VVLSLRSVTAKRIAWAWVALLAALLFVQTLSRAQRPGGIDLTSYLLSARALLDGRSPYPLPTPFPYLYPATLAFLLIPLTFAPAPIALAIWFALNGAALWWSTQRVLVHVRPELETDPSRAAAFLAVFFTFFFTIVQSNLRNGQVNFLVVALCVAAVVPPRRSAKAFALRQSGQDGLDRLDGKSSPEVRDVSVGPASPAGPASTASGAHSARPAYPAHPARPAYPAHPALPALSWSLAVALKLLPLVLVPFFLLRRHVLWVVASGAFVAAWALAPVVVVGSRIADIYEQYWRVFLATSLAPRVQPLDFSLAGTIAWATRTPLSAPLRLSAAAIVVGWILQLDGRQLRERTLQPFALYMLAVPLVSPQSEMHHLAFMLPAAMLVAATQRQGARESSRTFHRSTAAFRGAAAAAAILYVAGTVTPIASGPLLCAALVALMVAVRHAAWHG
jgi:Glycosyltransferase family 87